MENCKPILCDKIKYFEDPAFTERANHPVPSIPLQDVDLFVAKLEDRKRDVEASDFDDPNFVNRIEDIDKVPDLPDNISDFDTAEINALVDNAAAAIADNVVKPVLDTTKYQINADTAASMAQNMFGSDDDEDEEDEGFDLVAAPASSSADEQADVLSMLDSLQGKEPETETTSDADSPKDQSETPRDTEPYQIEDEQNIADSPLNDFGLSAAADDEDSTDEGGPEMQKDLTMFGFGQEQESAINDFESQSKTRS